MSFFKSKYGSLNERRPWKNPTFKGAIVFLSIWFFLYLFRFIGFECTQPDAVFVYRILMLFGVPIAILFTLSGTMQSGMTKVRRFLVLTGTVLLASILFIFQLMTALFSMCGWVEGPIMFQKKSNPNVCIYTRYIDCGAWDSDAPNPKLYKVRTFTPFFIHASRVDTAELDMNEWERLEKYVD